MNNIYDIWTIKKQLEEDKITKSEFEASQERVWTETGWIPEREPKFTATQILSKYGFLYDNLSFLPFVTSETEEEMMKNVELLKASIDKNIESKVKERFKASGRDLGGSSDNSSSDDK